MASTKISIEALIEQRANDVWEKYTNPEHIVHWNFASEDWHCPSAHNDVRVGGKLRSRMEAKDGSFGFYFEATYQEVLLYKKLSYIMPDGRKVEVTFKDLHDKTQLLTDFDAEETHSLEVQREGWQSILDNFKKYVESRD